MVPSYFIFLGASRESFTLDLLDKFRKKLHAAKEKTETEGENDQEDIPSDEEDTSDKWCA